MTGGSSGWESVRTSSSLGNDLNNKLFGTSVCSPQGRPDPNMYSDVVAGDGGGGAGAGGGVTFVLSFIPSDPNK
jgi:hypothetical protein